MIMKAKQSWLYPALVLIILLVINIISDKLFFRVDFTADNRYTLSDATKSILANLDEPVTLTAYYSDDLPAEILRSKRDFKDLLTEYHNISHGQFDFKFVNASSSEEAEQEALNAGVYPIMLNVREKDQVRQQRAFMGAVVEKGRQKEILPIVQPEMPIEYALSSAIRKMSSAYRPLVGMLQGHGEPPLMAMQQALTEMEVICNVQPIDLQQNSSALDSVSVLAIVAPIDSIQPSEFAAIDRFIARGGRIFIAIDRVDANLDNLFVNVRNTGLEQWLMSKDISVESKLAIDNYCANVSVQQQQGAYRVNVQQQFPYIPFIGNFGRHSITNGLEQVQLQFVSPVVYTGDSLAVFTPLLYTSDHSATLNVPTVIDVQRQWTARDFPLAEVPLGGLLEGTIGGVPDSKMIVIGNGSFATNGNPRQPRQQSPDNISLMVNSIDYLSDDTGLVDLRTKGVTARPIAQLDDGTRVFIKWLNVLLPIVLVVLIGIIRSQQQRNRRIKRMEEGYVE